jgi:hypothetical protein
LAIWTNRGTTNRQITFLKWRADTVNTSRLVVIVLAVALAALSAQKRPAPAPPSSARSPAAPPARAERAVPFQVGERLTYDITWSSFITATAATATVTVREKRPAYGSLAYYIVAEGQPTPLLAAFYSLYYKVDTWLDVYTLLPLRASIFSQERARRENQVTLFDQARDRARFEVGDGTTTTATEDLRLPPHAHDPLSAIVALRSLPMKAGTRTSLPMTLNGVVYQLQVTIDGRESLRTAVGTSPAWRMTPVLLERGTPVASPRAMTLWISDDARRLPLKMQVEMAAGTFVLTIRTFH